MRAFVLKNLSALFILLALSSATAHSSSCQNYFSQNKSSKVQAYLNTTIQVAKLSALQTSTAIRDYAREVNESPYKSRILFVTPNEPPLKWGGLFRYEEARPSTNKNILFRALDYVFDGLPRRIAKGILKDDQYRFSPFFFIGRWTLDKPVRAVTRELFYSEKEFTVWGKIPIFVLAFTVGLKTYANHMYDSYMPEREQTYLKLDAEQNRADYIRAIQTDYRFKYIKIDGVIDEAEISEAQLINSAIQSYYKIRAESGIKLLQKPRKDYSKTEISEELHFQIETYSDHPLFLGVADQIGAVLESRPPVYRVNGTMLLGEAQLLDLFLNQHTHIMRMEYLDIAFSERATILKRESESSTQSDLFKSIFSDRTVSAIINHFKSKYGESRFNNDANLQLQAKYLIQEYLESANKLKMLTIMDISLHRETPPHQQISLDDVHEEFLTKLDNF